MSDIERLKEMLAKANMRYSVTCSDEETVLIVNGSRNERPMSASVVELYFASDKNGGGFMKAVGRSA